MDADRELELELWSDYYLDARADIICNIRRAIRCRYPKWSDRQVDLETSVVFGDFEDEWYERR